MLGELYERINKKNTQLVAQASLNGFCRAIWCEDGFSLNASFDEMISDLRSPAEKSEDHIYYDLGMASRGRLHFTLFQLQTFNVDPSSWPEEKINDATAKLKYILATEPPFSVSFKGLVKTAHGIFMAGYPSYDVNRIRNRIREIFGDEIVEPHPQDIFHSTVLRLTKDISEDELAKINTVVDKYSDVSFGEVLPSNWIFGYGTWTQAEPIRLASWPAAPKHWILHRGLAHGPDENLENCFENLLAKIKDGWEVEVDVWFEDGRWLLGHDYEVAKKNEISEEAMIELLPGSWFHCKNVRALCEAGKKGWRCFSHDCDEVVLTSTGQIWCYPGVFSDGTIAVLPEKYEGWKLGKHRLVGVCSDYMPDKFI
jgi:hypothetical protein